MKRSLHMLPISLRKAASLVGLLSVLSPARALAQATGGTTPDAAPGQVASTGAQGSVGGMGESFSASVSTGGANYEVPLAVPMGRATLMPDVKLTYASGAGSSSVGFGWNLPLSFIGRSRDHGAPGYDDRPAFHRGEDRLILGNGQDLVPIDSAQAAARDG